MSDWAHLKEGGKIKRITTRVVMVQYPDEEPILLPRAQLYENGTLIYAGSDTGTVVINNAYAVHEGLATG